MFFYYLELLFSFIALMVFGMIFSPFFGGCLGAVIILLLLVGFIIFFSLNFIWFLLAGGILYACGALIKYWRWYKLPQLQEYLSLHPECKLAVGVSCCNCNSQQISHHGLFHQTSKTRFYSCDQCGSVLFRFRVL
jgi:hypothetical protein